MSQLNKFIYEKDKIVIGGDLRALLYAYCNELPVIFVDSKPPFRFNTLEKGHGFFGPGPETQLHAWERLIFLLGMAGLMPLSDKATSLRVEDNILKVATSGSKLIKLKFNKLIIFDDENIFGLPEVVSEKVGYNKVIDWFAVRSGCRHDLDELSDVERFVKDVIFYPSDRFDGKTKLKDAVSTSYLTNDELQRFEFSETYAKFKLMSMMKEAGIRGARNGRIKEKPGKYRYYALKVDHAGRQIYSNVTRRYRKDENDRFIFNQQTLDEIMSSNKPTGYVNKICSTVFT